MSCRRGDSADRTRRQLLRTIGVGGTLVGLGGARLLSSQPQRTGSALNATTLRDGVVQIGGAGGNVVVLGSSDGLLWVDSGAAEQAQQLMAFVGEKVGPAPVRVLFNTHWHLDHTGGNDAIVRDGVTAVAHENTRLWMSTKFFVDWENKRYLPRDPGALPNKTFLSHQPQPQGLAFGGANISYAHLVGAHTDGDIYVAFHEQNIIVAGGAVTANEYPTLDYITGGWIGGMVEATKKLIALSDANTLIVPGVGPPRKRTDLQMQLEMLETVRERIEAIALEGRGVEDMIAEQITKDFDSHYRGDPGLFIANAYEGMWWRLRGTVA